MMTMAAGEAAGKQISASRRSYSRLGDALFLRITQLFALSVIGVVLLAVVTTTWQAMPAIHAFGPGFLSSKTWDPVAEKFGAWPFIWGTLYSSLLGLALAL